MGYSMNEYTDMHLGPSLLNDFSISLSAPTPLLTFSLFIYRFITATAAFAHSTASIVRSSASPTFDQRVHRHLRVWHHFQLVVCTRTVES
jgi:hypothetical protein